jgi:hypothetical protein
VVRRFSQFATRHAAFIQLRRFRPLGRLFFEVTLRLLLLRPDDLLTILKMGFVNRLKRFGFPPPLYPSYEVLTFASVGLPPTKHISLSFSGHAAAQLPTPPVPSLRFAVYLAIPNARLGAEQIASPFS